MNGMNGTVTDTKPALQTNTLTRINLNSALLMGLWLAVTVIWLIGTEAFIAEDSYFYLVIARNMALAGEQTFSGITGTNGVHPLWLYVLSGYSWLVAQIDADLLYRAQTVVPLSAALVAVGTVLYWQVGRLLKVNPFLFTLIPMGYVSMLGVLASEGHLLYLTLGLFCYVLLSTWRERSYGFVLIGLSGAGVLLARLDMIFVVGCLYLWYLHREGLNQRGFMRVIASGVVLSVPVLLYLASNQAIFGATTPISGWLKSSFPEITLSGLQIGSVTTTNLAGYSMIFGVIPISAIALLLIPLWRRLDARCSIVLAFIAGSLLHFVYIALFTTGFTSWVWYYILPFVTLGMMVTLFAQEFIPTRLMQWGTRGGVIIILSLTIGNMLVEAPTYNQTFSLDYLDENGITDTTVLVSEWPGRVAFYSRNRIIAADMLTSNRIFFDEMTRSEDAFTYVFDAANAQGTPVEYLVWVGGRWIFPDDDFTRVEYLHPRTLDTVVGQLEVGQPDFVNPDEFVAVWRLRAD